MAQQLRDPPIVGTGERLQSTPEQPVMHQEQVDPLLCTQPHRRLVQIHGRTDPGHFPGVRHLQSVDRLGGISDRGHSQVVV